MGRVFDLGERSVGVARIGRSTAPYDDHHYDASGYDDDNPSRDDDRARGDVIPSGDNRADWVVAPSGPARPSDDYILMVTEEDASDALTEMAHEAKGLAVAWAWATGFLGFIFGIICLASFVYFSPVIGVGVIIAVAAFLALGVPMAVSSHYFGTSFD